MNDAHLAFEGAVERRVGCGFRASRREGEVREAMRGRDGGDPPDEPWLSYRLYEWAEGCPVALRNGKEKRLARVKKHPEDMPG
jgi:hypothetical protein